MLISIAIPCYNSEKTIENVVKEIKEVFSAQAEYDYQIVLVNDRSPDDTFGAIRRICENDTKVIGVDLSKNYGQASAQMAALQYVKGDITVFMDDDGQHPPQEIFKLIDKVNEGFDVVFAAFPQKKHSIFKRLTSRLNSWMLEVTNRKMKGVTTSSYFALSKFASRAMLSYKSPFPSLGGYLMQITRKMTNVEISHRERMAGKSNYSLKKLIKLWLQGFTNFSIAPLRFASWLGGICAMTGIGFAVYLVIRKIIGGNVQTGYTSLMAVVLVVGGLIMLMLGMLGEYIGRMYILLSNMPQYSVRSVLNNEEETDSK